MSGEGLKGVPGGAAERTRLPVQETQETRVRTLGQEDAFELEVATHSVILAWDIPQSEEPVGLQSTGSQRVGHD